MVLAPGIFGHSDMGLASNSVGGGYLNGLAPKFNCAQPPMYDDTAGWYFPNSGQLSSKAIISINGNVTERWTTIDA
jgi:hypothetical protein